jgi:DNA-binding NtrC family response regulator
MRALSLENAALRRGGAAAREELARTHELCGLVYESRVMHELVSLALRASRSSLPVLITGPAGSGKELIADIVQANSARAEEAYVKVNAAAIPDSLVESELFGAEKGAYTGGERARVGRFEAADGGTLLLDEIGLLALSGQAKLLRVLQDGRFERLGSSRTRSVDVRVICATNEDLENALAEGRSREDLYFRLNAIELRVPPLGERRDDILPLAEHFLALAGEGAPPSLGDEARAALVDYDWPGNVRELANRVARARVVASGESLREIDFDLGVGKGTNDATGQDPLDAAELAERVQLQQALELAEGNVSTVARELGVSRQALYRRMKRLGIVLERRPRS